MCFLLHNRSSRKASYLEGPKDAVAMTNSRWLPRGLAALNVFRGFFEELNCPDLASFGKSRSGKAHKSASLFEEYMCGARCFESESDQFN